MKSTFDQQATHKASCEARGARQARHNGGTRISAVADSSRPALSRAARIFSRNGLRMEMRVKVVETSYFRGLSSRREPVLRVSRSARQDHVSFP